MTSVRGDVSRWVRVSARWFGHRPEPLLHERLWGCSLLLDDDDDHGAGTGWRFDAGIDERGHPIAFRVSGPYPESGYVEYVVRARGVTTVRLGDGTTVRTEHDDAGRPVRTTYEGGWTGEEAYVYDDAGRLVRIEEAKSLWCTAIDTVRNWTGGSLSVEHDGRGPLKITGAQGVEWERSDASWPEILCDGARAIHEGVLRVSEKHCRSADVSPDTEIFGLTLMYTGDSGLGPIVRFGLESDRRRWLSARPDPHELACSLWSFGDDGLGFIDHGNVIDWESGVRLLREASLKQPGDPRRVLLTAAARSLARHDWHGLLTPTKDFVVFIAEHDEGFRPKHDSVRAVNPSARLAVWDAHWPPGVSRGEDEPG